MTGREILNQKLKAKENIQTKQKKNCENVQLSKEELTANLQATSTTILSFWRAIKHEY